MSLVKKLLPRIAREFLCSRNDDSIRTRFPALAAHTFVDALPSELRGKPMSTYLDLILPPSDLRNLKAYEADFQQLPAGSQYLVDIVQSPGYGCVARSIMPTLDTHPKVYSFDH